MKQTNRNKFLTMLAACILALLPALVSSCSENEGEGPFRVSGVILPSSIDVTLGEAVRIDVSGTPPAVGDEVLLVSSSGEQFSFPVSAADERGFSFVIDDPEFVSGTYTMYIRRGADGTKVGSTAVNVIYGIEITPDEGVTVYGVVTASNRPVPGVVISDGHEVTVTDQDGVYQLRSGKERGYVFMSVPGGYEALSDGVLPRFHATLTENAETPERKDFYLSQAPNSEFTLIVMGDMHLADRRTATDDRQQFRRFAEDLNEYLSQNSGEKIYALTLGDMTWDYYWTECQYSFPEYIEDMNSLFTGLQVYHTIGNHDHSMEFAGDWAKINQYITNIGPNWYSFNIGDCHFVVLDDIDFRDDISDRDDYVEDVSDEQLEWLRKDLQYVEKGSTVIVATHAPVYSDKSLNPSIRLGSTSDLFACLEGYTTHFLTGHTHRMLNADRLSDRGHFEHNAGAVCADWWWSYKESGIHISTDGAPGGYSIFEFTGNGMKWRYKATDFSDSYQFRSYDLNNIHITADKYVPNANDSHKSSFRTYVNAYPENKDNEVLINVWNWDPSWSVEVTENGTPLEVTRVLAYDPLHIIAYTAKRLDKNATATFPTNLNSHFFKATASSPDSDLQITVTDRFGRVYSETMERPKAFDIATYLKE